MDDTILTNVLIDHTGAVDVEALASLLHRVRKVVGVFSLSISPRSLDAHEADHLVTGLATGPEEVEKKDCVRRDTGELFWYYDGSVDIDGEELRVILFCKDGDEEVACAS